MKTKGGFTLLELIMVVIIIGVLAGLAIPQYINAVERAKAGKAISNLGLIRQAQHLYRADSDEYSAADSSSGWQAVLGMYVELTGVDNDLDWDYDTTANDESTFTVEATRTQGPYGGDFIEIDQDGISGGDWTLPY
ncbi:MAG TPA: prepilin-type N-terminal cleavage/methylation domain-containing protein [Candidatus Omnitrophica bacterium]|nr:prepilin-type N-terminal cleavage/methylation domain-containing protein [Candidatus Omnitrophota bacterium]